ncbi:recombination mediator RecR [Microscilla marina]|uniref:Recombination protein RecR n=1 Tax=Microscilla marina ATCC 23134 TaxID=313606 RepID=A1ZHK5_MICM2|nr:recombination mediator RecR [Microscilla marina]EAY30012.1 recombination protein RecR [Microscilla marina ATCC 23134]
MIFSSKLIEDAVDQIAGLPGIGKKTALRLVFHLLKQDEKSTVALTDTLLKLRRDIVYCNQCHHISDTPTCNICNSNKRDRTLLCVVEDSQDVLAIENTAQYQGLYHVLGGVISPMEGVSPIDLHITSLLERVAKSEIKEVIFALSPTMEGDTTTFYLTKKLREHQIKISTIARGVPIGSELEYTDEITLGRSIIGRTTYE